MASLCRVERILQQLGITLPVPVAPVANYVPYVLSGSHLHVSGQMSIKPDGSICTGQLGTTMEVDEGKEAARTCALLVVSQIRAALGDLDRVTRIVKLNVFVNSSPSFTQHPFVANGASDLIVSVFGADVGRHARCAVGVAQLPFGAAVEVDALVEVSDTHAR
ncbi:Endoribonuclease L-PSP/chorismate mutase-like [Trypanosoma melophagium]|uniref:Endoribonuclease L-PSP/chorismate mutase-like n=1 Tax=Trypanosoma melophagium TaxID=715481 RepID=UPI00351A94FF|nr:Endoribonuclease L-PSP/chorismate mutase-like [Trypanosoma melophagium]